MGEDLKKMAEILKSGATMLQEACPQCLSPLFKLASGEIYCARCDRRVVIVKGEEAAPQAAQPATLSSLEKTILKKLSDIEDQINRGKDSRELQPIVTLIIGYLDILQRIKNLRESRKPS